MEHPSLSHPYYTHHHHLYNPPPPLPSVVAPPLYFPDSDQQQIHTLFVSGLPDDVKAREIHNLFRRRHGFDSCLLEYTGRGNQVVAFATFFDHQSAVAAMRTLNGVIFDPHSEATLHIELARSNSRKRPGERGEAYRVIDKRIKATNNNHETRSGEGDGGNNEPSGSENDDSDDKDSLTAIQSEERVVAEEIAQAASDGQLQLQKPLSSKVPPCSTLFIANLGPSCNEEELKQVFSKYGGFHTLKIQARRGMPVAFADFTDIESSTAAMNGLQGTSLSSSDRGGMHLEYAKSKMRS